MNYYYISGSDWPSAVQVIVGMRRPYEIKETSNSRLIRNDRTGYLTADLHIQNQMLGRLNSVKAEIYRAADKKEIEVLPAPFCLTSEYFNNELPPRTLYVSEVDLCSAYWTAARQMELISQETYERFLKYKTKKFRLIALGMLARRQLIRRFDERNQQIETVINQDERGKEIFRAIASRVSDEMFRLSELYTELFLFYWADNLVALNTLRTVESKFGTRIKSPVLLSFRIERNHFHFLLDGRPFVLPLSSLRKTLFDVPF